jgi:uncharacterized protein YcbX
MTGRFTIPGAQPAIEPPHDAPAPPDFDRLFALVALVADHKACAKRLEQLHAATAAATEALAVLAAKRASHDEAVARDRADIERQQQELRQREVTVHAAEARSRHERERLVKEAAEDRANRFEHFPSGDGGRDLSHV